MLLSIYIFLTSVAVVLVSRPLRFDPTFIILPSALILIADVYKWVSVYISLIPCLLVFALCLVFPLRNELQLERLTRIGTGLSLGSFVGIQFLILLPISLTMLVILMMLSTCIALVLNRSSFVNLLSLPKGVSLWSGIFIGVGQVLTLGAGWFVLAADKQLGSANRYVLWLFSLIGVLVGVIALPEEVQLITISWPVLLANGLGLMAGGVLLRFVSHSLFESKILNWTVLAMCLSVWGHVLIKHYVLSS